MAKRKLMPKVVYVEKPRIQTPFLTAVEEYRRFKKNEGKLSINADRTIHVWSKAFGELFVHDITQSAVDEYVSKNMSHMQPNTIKRNLNILRAIVNDAYMRGFCDRIIKIKAPAVFDERDEHLSETEVAALLGWAMKNLEPIEMACLATAIYTGARVNELVAMRGDDFGEHGVVIRKRGGKTRDTRAIPYAASYRRLVFPHMLGTSYGGNPVFSTVGANAGHMSNALGRILKEGCAAIGVTRNVRVHDLRHTFAYLCGCAGMDIGDLQVLLGHSSIAMTMRYRGFIKSRALGVMEKM